MDQLHPILLSCIIAVMTNTTAEPKFSSNWHRISSQHQSKHYGIKQTILNLLPGGKIPNSCLNIKSQIPLVRFIFQFSAEMGVLCRILGHAKYCIGVSPDFPVSMSAYIPFWGPVLTIDPEKGCHVYMIIYQGLHRPYHH